ncbi:MAG: hypothetical protein ACFFDP_09040 [Promethearchaeota archaeon]
MAYFETAKLLVRYGALIGIILGIVAIAFSGLSLVASIAFWAWWGFSIIPTVASIGLSVLSVICSFLVYTVYYPKMDKDPKGIAVYLIIFGILMMIGAWGIGGLLVLIGAILIFLDQEESS